MALVFGSPEAIEILEKNREIQRRLATAQEDYDRMLGRLGDTEAEIEELEHKRYSLEKRINELLQLAETHGVFIERE